ncbi:MAG: nucleoside triphosphate pyrophosphohydrolase [Methylacidiphilales bacterium]|nr:nucleoside triphosphate pyrophosphohydrolase [Candidatus Methylacidiphilales bacterium]MDW8349308.1 nucleoside triphosphate pyrophosphohydrolase [Verrucomicrobiae bacterium]
MKKSPYSVDDLLEIMARLRGPDGCPWDREQTHRSIKGHLIEECYELIDAIDRDDYEEMKEEAGDLLLHVIFHAQMASEKGKFNFYDIVQTLAQKLIRRHPHVFGSERVSNADEVLTQWNAIKRTEKPERTDPLQSLPTGLPPLQRAFKLQKIAAQHFLDWPEAKSIIPKIKEELDELDSAIADAKHERIEEELGDLFFTFINLARRLNIDADSALARANQKFSARLAVFLKRAAEKELDLSRASQEEIDQLWSEAKSSAEA